jgi:TonB family protein
MRRMLFALFVIAVVAVPAGLTVAQVPDPIVVSARQLSQKGDHDTAIKLLRSTLSAHPNDEVIKSALVDALTAKRQSLMREASELEREISALMPERVPGTMGRLSGWPPRTVAGCPSPNPVRVGGGIRTPRKVHDVPPVYPPEAQASRAQGLVIMEALLDCDGRIADVRVLRGQPLLNEAALEAVRQWEYTPTLLNGVPVPVIMTVTVTFSIQRINLR